MPYLLQVCGVTQGKCLTWWLSIPVSLTTLPCQYSLPRLPGRRKSKKEQISASPWKWHVSHFIYKNKSHGHTELQADRCINYWFLWNKPPQTYVFNNIAYSFSWFCEQARQLFCWFCLGLLAHLFLARGSAGLIHMSGSWCWLLARVPQFFAMWLLILW